MSPAFTKLRAKLSELFQLDAAAELDFGIYRILNARRGEVERFLDSLEEQVAGELRHLDDTATAGQRAELDKLVADLRGLAVEEAAIDQNKKVAELRAKLAEAPDLTSLQNDLFSHLTTFFSRYYKDGDFLSLRRYKKDTYAIPYEGEEVKLHWANSDQYYIKSTENFRDYTFRLGAPPAADKPDGRSIVTFKLVEADTQKDNTKATAGQERRFVFQGVIPSDAGNFVLGFAYLPLGKDQKQKELNASAHQQILAYLTEEMPVAQRAAFLELAAADKTYTVKGKTRTVLEKHLTEYTAKNTFDYFIHKDLGGFLRRELDFYIKNEVIHLDDLENAPETNWQQMQARVKTLRLIAGKVIRFLAQIEDFQKKLWLKKKFVTRCDYVITLDRIPESLYPEIAACDAQREEWVRLHAIDEIQGDLGRAGYSVPLTVDFLKENQALAVDTGLFGESQTSQEIRLQGLNDKHSLCVHGDNMDGLKILTNKHGNHIDCVCIDPPYNTGSDGFCYKDGFKSSSWLAQQSQTTPIARHLLSDDGSFFAFNDENQAREYSLMLEAVFGRSNFVETIIWNKRVPKNDKGIGNIHDFVFLLSKNLALRRERKKDYSMRKDELDEIYELVRKLKSQSTPVEQAQDELKKFYRKQGYDRGITLYCELDPNFRIWGKINMSWPNAKTKGPRYPVISPVTGKEVPIPDNGWRWTEDTFRAAEKEGPTHTLPDGSIMKGKIWYSTKQTVQPSSITYLDDVESFLLRSILSVKSDGSVALEGLGFGGQFDYPKSVLLIERLVHSIGASDSAILDYFGGSGTTGHAVINLNREDGGTRRYILIEMGEHFDTVLVPRLKKVIYAKDWKDGKPVSRNTGISHCFKVLRLESYEDTLNNLRLHRTPEQTAALDELALTAPEAAEEYRLGYLLDVESAGSQSLLNISAFNDPWNYTLEVSTGTAGETKPVAVDLVETFNWLLGLTVNACGSIRNVHWVEGTNPEGERVLVLWRNTATVPAEALNAWCQKQKMSVADGEFSFIYVNGDHHLENLRRPDQTWKVRLIDEEFPRLMWEGC